jgi:hypothetical protein
LLYLPKGITRYEKLDYSTADVVALFRELAAQDFTGYLEIVSPVQRGFFGWHIGRLYTAFYDGDDGRELSREDVLRHFILKKKRNAETVINVTELDPRLAEATGLLTHRPPLYRELETGFIDMVRLFDTLNAKRFVGVLRFYHVRSHTRLGNILIKMNKITRDQLQQAVRLQLSHQGALRLGDALVQIGAIEPADLGSALDLQSHARKGSDIELALAAFYEGDFLGGYTHIHKQFKTSRDEILPQLVGTEVLMDILEGGLPDPLDLEALLNFPEQPAPAPDFPPPLSTPQARVDSPEEPNPFSGEDGFNLKAEDLILDLHPQADSVEDAFLTLSTTAEEVAEAPAPPRPRAAEKPPVPAPLENLREPDLPAPVEPPKVMPEFPPRFQPEPQLEPEPEPELAATVDWSPDFAVQSIFDEPEPGPVAGEPEEDAPAGLPAAVSAITAESRGLAYVLEVARDFLGPLGGALLRKEAAPLPLQGRDWPETQLRELVLRFFRSALWILGRTRSEHMLEKIRERIEV